MEQIFKYKYLWINLDTKKLRSQRLLQTQITTATNEEKAALKSVEELKKTIREATARGDEELRQLELNKISEHFQKLIEQAEANNLVTDELKAARDLAIKDKEQHSFSFSYYSTAHKDKINYNNDTVKARSNYNNDASITFIGNM